MDTRTCRRCGVEQPLDKIHFRLRNGRTFEWVCLNCNRAATRAHHETHREELNQKARERYWSNPEKKRIRSREVMQRLRKEHPEKDRENSSRYYRNHRDERLMVMRERGHARRTGDKRLREMKGVIQKQWNAQTGKDGVTRCWWCETPLTKNRFHVDHVIPIALGGTNDPRNLVLTCPHCNLSKNKKLAQDWCGRLF